MYMYYMYSFGLELHILLRIFMHRDHKGTSIFVCSCLDSASSYVATCVAVVRRDRFDSKTPKNVELEIRCDSGNDDRGSCRGHAHPFASYTGS